MFKNNNGKVQNLDSSPSSSLASLMYIYTYVAGWRDGFNTIVSSLGEQRLQCNLQLISVSLLFYPYNILWVYDHAAQIMSVLQNSLSCLSNPSCGNSQHRGGAQIIFQYLTQSETSLSNSWRGSGGSFY